MKQTTINSIITILILACVSAAPRCLAQVVPDNNFNSCPQKRQAFKVNNNLDLVEATALVVDNKGEV
ncbi:hypothetical protein NIES2101_35910 [Calothrix sp. HK-06]|nr:hypothetical protein NIES2101_35910 [Calothrix sp. HK-06]